MSGGGEELTHFTRLDDSSAEPASASGSSSVFGGFFSRWLKPSVAEEVTPSSAALPSVDSTLSTTQCDGESRTQPSLHSDGIQNGATVSPSGESPASRKSSASSRISLSTFFGGRQADGLVDYNRSDHRQYWMPDSTGRACYQCEGRFTAVRRRHHCRLCGRIFCSKCCNHRVSGAQFGYTGDLRLCGFCIRMVRGFVPDSSDSSPPSMAAESGMGVPGTPHSSQLPPPPPPQPISTVSGGSLDWGGNSSQSKLLAPTSRGDPLLKPPPSLLSVQELYMRHETANGGDSGSRRLSADAGTSTGGEDEESGPEWLRGIDMTRAASESWAQPPAAEAVDSAESAQSGSFRSNTEEMPSPSKTPVGRTGSGDIKIRTIDEDDIDKAFETKASRLLDYLLLREQVLPERWRETILRVSWKAASEVEVDVMKRKDSMNILHYVHIKKICAEEDATHAEVVPGVICTQTVTHTSMANEARNASVMLVRGAIEYERGPGRLATIDNILAQENEFLILQVERILARRPSIVLVEKGASRIVTELLRENGVRCVLGVKERVLERIGRATGADILPSSDAQLLQQSIGFCPVFAQRLIKLRGGREKRLIVFDECPIERGCSILLYSHSPRELRAVKRILQTMTLLFYSMRLEKAFVNQFGVRLEYRLSACEVCEARRESIEHDDKSDMESALEGALLTMSPYIEVEPPFLETPRGRHCALLDYFKQPLYAFGTEVDFVRKREEDDLEDEKEQPSKNVSAEPRHPFANGTGMQNEDEVALFRAFGGKLFRNRIGSSQPISKQRVLYGSQQCSPMGQSGVRTRPPPSPLAGGRQDVLNPLLHQRVAVLFGSFSPKSPNAPFFCVRPWVVSMHFYGNNDMTLGEFLTKYCFNKDYMCPSQNCEVPMLEHSRKLVCARVCVEVTTQQVTQQNVTSDENGTGNGGNASVGGGGVDILCWHYCPSCKASSPLIPLDTQVWHLSLAKVLDYLAHSSFSLSTSASTGSLGHACQHCFFHQQSHFFSQGNYVTTFKLSMIRPFDVLFSPLACRIERAQQPIQSLIDGVTRMAALAHEMATVAEGRLKEKRDSLAQCNSSVLATLEGSCRQTSTLVSDRLAVVEELKAIAENDSLSSADPLSAKARDAVTVIRDAAFQLLSGWNSECASLAAASRVRNKTADDNGLPPPIHDVTLDRLDDPFPSFLHLGLPLPSRAGVVVRDLQDSRGSRPDIGSIVAYALATLDYEEGRRKAREAAGGEEPAINLHASSMADESAVSGEHLESEFSDSTASYYVKTYFAERFRLLRRLLLVDGEESFIRSLSESAPWTPQGGKSGAHFYRSCDDRFVIKQMSRFEVQSFVKFAPNYLDYLKTAVTEHKLTTLCKVYGVFRVGYKSKTTQVKMDILVMEYLFYKHEVSQVWDLKGSLRNRWASAGKNSSDLVLLDENLMKDLWNNQLYVLPHSKAALNQAISNDSHFLSSQHVMDYSLLVGVDRQGGQLILGIVDYMRTYTLDKKLESWVKIVAIPGGHLPTVVSPQLYCTRFSEAIDSYFPVVPDQWTGLGSVVSY